MKDFNIGKILQTYMKNGVGSSKHSWRKDEKYSISLLYHELFSASNLKDFISELINDLKDVNVLEICSVQYGQLFGTELRSANPASLIAEEIFEKKQEYDMIEAFFLEKSSPMLANMINMRTCVSSNFSYADTSLRGFDLRGELVLSLPDMPNIKTETLTTRFRKGNAALLALKLMRLQQIYCINYIRHNDVDYNTLSTICSGKTIMFSVDEKKKEFSLSLFPFQSAVEKVFMPAYPLWQAKQHLDCLLKSELALTEILIAVMER